MFQLPLGKNRSSNTQMSQKHLSYYHNKYVVFPADITHNNIGFLFVCKSHYLDCLIKVLSIDNLLGNPTYIPTTLTKDEILEIMNLCCVRFAFQQEMKNWIVRHSTGYINCTSDYINSGIVLRRLIAPRDLFPNDSISKLSTAKTGLSTYCDNIYSRMA